MHSTDYCPEEALLSLTRKRNSHFAMHTEVSLPFSQESATGPYPEQVQSAPHLPIPLHYDAVQYSSLHSTAISSRLLPLGFLFKPLYPFLISGHRLQ